MQGVETKLKSVTRARPCQLCEGIDGCSVGDNGLMLCRRRQGQQVGFVCLGTCKKDPQWTAYRREGDPLLDGNHRQQSTPPNGQHKPAVDWQAKAAGCARDLTADRAGELAAALGLPEAVLSELPLIGFCAAGPHTDTNGQTRGPCWTFPERDGAGDIIGLTCRYLDGQKKAWPGGQRGLTISARWREREGAIFLPEGQSDTLALTALGLAAIGRPSNMGGAKHLAELLRGLPAERPIFVLAEHDPKPDGAWPGRDGAVKTASDLAVKLGRVVSWAMPPDGAKDSRVWVIAQKLDPTCYDAWGDAGEDFIVGLKSHDVRPQDARPAQGFRWESVDSAEFDAADYRPAWLAKKALVALQAAVIGGPQKSLKTSLAIDLAVSLASATAWLGEFDCPDSKRVAVLSGESGPWALQSIARRVCQSKAVDLAGLGGNLRWLFTLPQLGVPQQLDALREGLERDAIEVVIVDPLFMCLLAGADGLKAENLYDTGPLLFRVAQSCLNAGATPILLHHCTKPSARKLEPLDLTDLAFSGIAEFTRQWVLLSRIEAYDPATGTHRLWMVTGGSVGHAGLHALDIDEGRLQEDFGGRGWAVRVSKAGDVRLHDAEAKEQAANEKREAKQEADAREILHAATVNDPQNLGVTYTALRTASGLTPERYGKAVTRLLKDGRLVESSGYAKVGNNANRPARILRRPVAETLV